MYSNLDIHTHVHACTIGRKIFAVENIRDAQVQCISEMIRGINFRGSTCAHAQCIIIAIINFRE